MFALKKKIVRLLFCLEIMLFSGNFLFSTNGLRAIMALRKENTILNDDIEKIRQNLQVLENELMEWHSSYKREKTAREQLHMARNDETIYFLS